ncbi:MAG: hypothetical protein V3U84_09795 [Thiotrichaceae bacterium]
MKKLLLGLALALSTTTANANFFGGNNNGEWKMGPNGAYLDESDWPQWTPMYWMEEMMDSFGFSDSNNFGNNFGFNGSSMNYPQMQQPYYTQPNYTQPSYAQPTAPNAYGQQQVPATTTPVAPSKK